MLPRLNPRYFGIGSGGGSTAGPAPGPRIGGGGPGHHSSNSKPDSSAAALHASPSARLYSSRASANARRAWITRR